MLDYAGGIFETAPSSLAQKITWFSLWECSILISPLSDSRWIEIVSTITTIFQSLNCFLPYRKRAADFIRGSFSFAVFYISRTCLGLTEFLSLLAAFPSVFSVLRALYISPQGHLTAILQQPSWSRAKSQAAIWATSLFSGGCQNRLRSEHFLVMLKHEITAPECITCPDKHLEYPNLHAGITPLAWHVNKIFFNWIEIETLTQLLEGIV